MTNVPYTPLHSPEKAAFDEFVMRFQSDLTVDTAAQVAKELGVDFYPSDYDV